MGASVRAPEAQPLQKVLLMERAQKLLADGLEIDTGRRYPAKHAFAGEIWIEKLQASDLAVLVYLQSITGKATGEACARYSTIAAAVGVGRATAVRSVGRLAAAGLVVRQQNRRGKECQASTFRMSPVSRPRITSEPTPDHQRASNNESSPNGLTPNGSLPPPEAEEGQAVVECMKSKSSSGASPTEATTEAAPPTVCMQEEQRNVEAVPATTGAVALDMGVEDAWLLCMRQFKLARGTWRPLFDRWIEGLGVEAVRQTVEQAALHNWDRDALKSAMAAAMGLPSTPGKLLAAQFLAEAEAEEKKQVAWPTGHGDPVDILSSAPLQWPAGAQSPLSSRAGRLFQEMINEARRSWPVDVTVARGAVTAALVALADEGDDWHKAPRAAVRKWLAQQPAATATATAA